MLATVETAGVLGQPPGTNHPKEPTQPSRTLPQHKPWTRITCTHNKEEARGARGGEHCTMENGARTGQYRAAAEVPKMGELTYAPQPPGVTRSGPVQTLSGLRVLLHTLQMM